MVQSKGGKMNSAAQGVEMFANKKNSAQKMLVEFSLDVAKTANKVSSDLRRILSKIVGYACNLCIYYFFEKKQFFFRWPKNLGSSWQH
jgi:hypothetical protein